MGSTARDTSTTRKLQRLRAKIESWRGGRYARAPLPEHLWAEAGQVAQQVGLNKARLALGLSYDGLRAHLPGDSAGGDAGAADFVELPSAALLAPAAPPTAATIEVSGQGGVHVVVRFSDASAVDVAALIDAVRGNACSK